MIAQNTVLDLNYQSPPTKRSADLFAIPLLAITGYFLASILTLPFLNAIWLGELPVLALIQLPKTALADWLRTHLVMPAIRLLGFSRGSFSPDYGLARPYGLVLAYLILLGLVFLAARLANRRRRPPHRSRRRWMWITLIAAALDFAFTLHFARGPELTIY